MSIKSDIFPPEIIDLIRDYNTISKEKVRYSKAMLNRQIENRQEYRLKLLFTFKLSYFHSERSLICRFFERWRNVMENENRPLTYLNWIRRKEWHEDESLNFAWELLLRKYRLHSMPSDSNILIANNA